MVILVELVEADLLIRIHRIVNADRDRHQRKPDVTFPDCSHTLPPKDVKEHHK
jgi:hypothetical protein